MEQKKITGFLILRLSAIVIFSLSCQFSFAETVFTDSFADEDTKSRFVMEAEDYSNRVATARGSWWQVDGKDNKFIEGPRAGRTVSNPYINKAKNNYMMALGRSIKNIKPTDSSYDGPFLDYKIQIKKPGMYNLYLHWIGRDGNADSVYAFILKPDNSLLAGYGPEYFLFHGKAWKVYHNWRWDNEGLQSRTSCSYARRRDRASWNIPEPGIYTIRLALREAETAVDALVFQSPGLESE